MTYSSCLGERYTQDTWRMTLNLECLLQHDALQPHVTSLTTLLGAAPWPFRARGSR